MLELFQHPLTEELLDTIIHITQGSTVCSWCHRVGVQNLTLVDFSAIVSTLLSRTTHWGKLKTQPSGHMKSSEIYFLGRVGFDTVGDQKLRKSLKRGFEFNLIVIGEIPLVALTARRVRVGQVDACQHTVQWLLQSPCAVRRPTHPRQNRGNPHDYSWHVVACGSSHVQWWMKAVFVFACQLLTRRALETRLTTLNGEN